MKILLIEDEIKIADFVLPGLRHAGFEADHIADGETGLDAIFERRYDLVVLDVMLPKMNGFDVLAKVRVQGNAVPIIMLTAKSELSDRMTAFERGVDDFLPKPFFVEELIARIKLLVGRKQPAASHHLTCGQLQLDIVDRRAHWHGVSAILSQREFSLLSYLIRSPGNIYSRQQILKHVWNIDFDPETNVVDVCIRRIRVKLSRGFSSEMNLIESIRGVGYRINANAGELE
jgi:DNA-binding response OmpR family regulator